MAMQTMPFIPGRLFRWIPGRLYVLSRPPVGTWSAVCTFWFLVPRLWMAHPDQYKIFTWESQ